MDVMVAVVVRNRRIAIIRRRERLDAHQRLKMFRRRIRDASNPFLIDPVTFMKYYRFTPHLAILLVEHLQDHIRALRPGRIPIYLQVLGALRFYAEGTYQKGVGNDTMHPVSQPTFSRWLHRVVTALSIVANQWIRFPATRQERQEISFGFERHSPIRGILGLIDCFLAKLVRPPNNEEAFFHHRHGPSLNIQVVCDHNKLIRSLRICPGASNDRHVYRYSETRDNMMALRDDIGVCRTEGLYYLLGDDGYGPSPVLLTPITDAPLISPERLYTSDHCQTRSLVERCFGDLTNTFLALSRRRVLPYLPAKAAMIVEGGGVLHNFKILNGVPLPRVEVNNPRFYDENDDYQAGLAERERLVNLYYRHRH